MAILQFEVFLVIFSSNTFKVPSAYSVLLEAALYPSKSDRLVPIVTNWWEYTYSSVFPWFVVWLRWQLSKSLLLFQITLFLCPCLEQKCLYTTGIEQSMCIWYRTGFLSLLICSSHPMKNFKYYNDFSTIISNIGDIE